MASAILHVFRLIMGEPRKLAETDESLELSVCFTRDRERPPAPFAGYDKPSRLRQRVGWHSGRALTSSSDAARAGVLFIA
jgi:hypothetical protein